MSRRSRAAIFFFSTAGLTLGAVVTFNTSRVDPLPGATVTSMLEPASTRTRPAGPVMVPAGPVPPVVVVPIFSPSGASSAAAWSGVLPISDGTGRRGSVRELSFPARSVSFSLKMRGSPVDQLPILAAV